MTDATGSRQVDGSRVSARWRIVGWIVLTAAVGLTGLILTVDRTMQAEVARRANAAVEQELAEFSQFAAQGRDPETAAPFASVNRLFEVYLSRQQPEGTELLVGRIGERGEWLEAHGVQVQAAESAVLEQHDAALLARILRERSGVTETEAGEIRWGSRQVGAGNKVEGTFGVVMFVGPMAQAASGTTRLLVGVGLGSLLLIAAMSYVVAGQILPVRDVRRAAAEISEVDLSRRIPVSGRDDVSEVAVQFNAMLDRLEEAFRSEQRFVDDAGHELRTPITVIRGHLELLGDDPEERRSTLALVTQELDRMSRIVSDLLSLAKAERPDFIQPRPGIDLAALTFELDAKVQALGDRRWGVAHVAEGTCDVDPERITQAVLQLAQNAVEHTRPGDRIVLTTRVDPPHPGRVAAGGGAGPRPGEADEREAMLVVAVTDEGPGVHPEDAPHLFERFARGTHGARSRSGAGLGLAIVRSIAEAHGGWAFLDSADGRGATFGVAVPARDYRAPGAPTEEEVALTGDLEGGSR